MPSFDNELLIQCLISFLGHRLETRFWLASVGDVRLNGVEGSFINHIASLQSAVRQKHSLFTTIWLNPQLLRCGPNFAYVLLAERILRKLAKERNISKHFTIRKKSDSYFQ